MKMNGTMGLVFEFRCTDEINKSIFNNYSKEQYERLIFLYNESSMTKTVIFNKEILSLIKNLVCT